MARRKNETGYDIEVTFMYEKDPSTKSVEYIDIPFDIFAEGIRMYGSMKSVNLDGTDISLWNLMVELRALDIIAEDKDFLDYCKELYLKSHYYEDDYEDWKDDYEYMHDLGEYAPKPEEE